jgi:hypothetical protein
MMEYEFRFLLGSAWHTYDVENWDHFGEGFGGED